MADPPFLGSGVAFPFQADASGAVRLRGGAAQIEQSIALILSTRPGERPMRPQFGCAVHSHVFAPSASPRTIATVTRAVQESLERWEPRIAVASVAAKPDPGRPEVLTVEIEYRIKSTNDVRNLVFPFYSIPPESAPAQVGADQ
jgi:uncharacterized protein